MRLCNGCVNEWLFEVPADLQAQTVVSLSSLVWEQFSDSDNAFDFPV